MSTPFASRFGMLSDRYGASWMITDATSGEGLTSNNQTRH